MGGGEGAFYSEDHGQTWNAIPLPVSRYLDNIDYDPGLGRVVITSRDSDMVFAINSDDKTWKWWNAGWRIRMVHSMDGHLVGASLYNGVVVEPEPDGIAAAEEAKK